MATLVGTPVAGYEASSADATIAISYGTAVQSGDVAIVFFGGYHASATLSSLTSSVGTSASGAVNSLRRESTNSPPSFLGAYYFVFNASGTPTFTVTMSANYGDKKISAIVWRGVDTSNPIEGSNGAIGADESAETGDVVVANIGPMMASVQEFNWASAHNHNVGTPNTGWTEWGDTATGSDNKYQNFASTGTRNGNFTWTTAAGGDAWAAIVVALRDASGGTDALTADDVQSTSNVTSPAIGQVHAILADDVQSASNVTSPVLAQVHALLADDIQSTSEVSAPAVVEVVPLTADDVESASSVTAPALGQKHVLFANDVESASELTAPTLGVEGEHTLLADDVQSTSQVSSPALGQVHALTATSVQSTSSVSSPALDAAVVAATRTRIVRNIRPTKYVPEKSPYDSDPKLRVYIEREFQAVARSLGNLPTLPRGYADVTIYGAAGDGTTDDSPAFQAAIDAVIELGGGTVVIPAGVYRLANQISVSGSVSGVHFRGAGMASTRLVNGLTGTDADPLILLEASGNYFCLEGFEVRGNGLTGASGNGHGIAAVNPGGVLFPQHVVLRDVLVRDHQGTSIDELGASIPSCGFFGYKSTGFVFEHAFFYLCNQGLRLHEMENFTWIGGGIDACLLNASYLKDCHDLAFFGGNQQTSGSNGATDGNVFMTGCENINFYGTEFKNGWPYNVSTRGSTTVNHQVGFQRCGFTQLDNTRGHTAASLNNASTSFAFEGCRFGFVNTITDAAGVELVQEASGWNTTGFRFVGNSFTIGGGGTIAAGLHFNVTSNRVMAPVIESNEIGFQHSIGSATVITAGVLFDGLVEGAAVRNNTVIGTTNLTITDGFKINSATVLGLVLENNEYRANGGTLTNEVNNAAGVAFQRRDRSHDGNYMPLVDGITAPSALSGQALLFVDTADGDLKVRFSDGTLKTIVTDT